jgi:transcriptional regulator with XRE-family HTH domain
MGALNERLAEVLKRKRQRDRLTQSDLGGRIGVSGSYISSLESAQSSARVTEIEQLAQVFRTTAFDLLAEAARDDGYRFSETNRERSAFLSLYDQLAPEQQKMARAFLLFLREQQERPGQEAADV